MKKTPTDLAVKEWEKNHKRGDRFTPWLGCFASGDPIIIFTESGGTETPWSVQYRGNGHYFKTKEEACRYLISRLTRKEIRAIRNTFIVMSDVGVCMMTKLARGKSKWVLGPFDFSSMMSFCRLLEEG